MALCDGTSDDSMLGLDDDDKDIQIWYNLNDNENSSSDSASDHLRQFFHIEPTVLRPRLQRSRHNGDTRERRRDTVQRQAAARRQMRILQQDLATATGNLIPTQTDLDTMRRDLRREDYTAIIARFLQPVNTLRTTFTSMVTLAVRSIKKASIANKKEQKNLRDHIKQYRSQLGVFEDQVSAKLERMCFTDYEDIDPAMKIVRHNLCQELLALQDYIRDCASRLNRRTRVFKTHPVHWPMATQQYLWEIACKSWPKLIEDKTINFHRASRIEQLQDHMALRAARIFETITKERAGHMKKRLRQLGGRAFDQADNRTKKINQHTMVLLGRRDEIFELQDDLVKRQSGLNLTFAYLQEMRNDRRQVEEMQSDTMEPGSKCPTVTSQATD